MPLLVIADTHINSKMSLCPELVTLDDGDDYHPNSFQQQLRAGYLEQIETVKLRLCKRKSGRRLTLVLNGDIADLDAKNRTNQVISRNEADVLGMTIDTLAGVVNMANRVYVIRGTSPAHSGASGKMEELYAADIGAEKDPDRGTSSWWHLRRIFDNRRFDITHHIAGNTPASVHTLARKMYEHCNRRKAPDERGERMPHYVVRSHVHRVFDTGKTWGDMRVLTTPCFGLPGEYMYRIGAESDYPQVGMVYFDGGDAEPEFLLMPFAARTWEIGDSIK